MPRVRDGYIRLGTRGHARTLKTQPKGSVCRENVIASARPCPPVPPTNLHGKEGVDGSSPSEGSAQPREIGASPINGCAVHRACGRCGAHCGAARSTAGSVSERNVQFRAARAPALANTRLSGRRLSLPAARKGRALAERPRWLQVLLCRACWSLLHPWIVSRVGVRGRAAVIDGFGAQFVVAGFVAADLAQPDDRRCGRPWRRRPRDPRRSGCGRVGPTRPR
jgi:hypothetical protein